jgi:hypothetical protein
MQVYVPPSEQPMQSWSDDVHAWPVASSALHAAQVPPSQSQLQTPASLSDVHSVSSEHEAAAGLEVEQPTPASAARRTAMRT